MKLEEFKKLFPKADMKYFSEDEDGVVVFKGMDDVSEPVFWSDDKSVSYLNLPFMQLADYEMDKLGFFKRYMKIYEYKITEKSMQPKSWEPREWSYYPTKVPDEVDRRPRNIDFENFRIYVNEKDFFMLNDSFPNFENVKELNFKDPKNIYAVSIKAMYVLSYLGGIGIKNLQSENTLAKSLAYFYFYYHMKKFLNYRDFSSYDLNHIYKKDWTMYNWRHHFVWYHKNVHYTEGSLKRSKDDIIRNVKHIGNRVNWETRLGKRKFGKDYLSMIKENVTD